ncbi:long-chain fatty acid--CoA ligase [Halorussus ruber]|uniref:long-chain fatty acid--CoA ligase n=1 Tax=Halorussus ruber TaxID=1126238 RepID=UPI001092389A|nr:long-chain fatty acid--CoA ligase [Halorussus ruber]
MDALGDLVARSRRSEESALLAPGENRTYDYHRFCTTAWKTGNFWRRRGVHDEATVAVADDPEPEVVFSFFGAALLGARTRFGLPDPAAEDLDARIAVAPADEIGDYEVPPGTQRVGYGGPPDDPAVAHFERDVWSENPSFPETPIDPGTVALVAGEAEFSHADLLSAAREVADDWGLEPGDEVAVRAPLADPGTVVAGIVAPLLAGAAILLPDEDSVGDFGVVAGSGDSDGGVPESETVEASAVI